MNERTKNSTFKVLDTLSYLKLLLLLSNKDHKPVWFVTVMLCASGALKELMILMMQAFV